MKLNSHKVSPEIYLIPIIVLLVFLIPEIPESFAVADISIEIPRDEYVSNDNVYISGTLYAPSSDILTLKVFDAEAKLVSKYQINIEANDTEFEYILVLSGDDWTNPGMYVILAEIDGEIDSANFTFEVLQNDTLIQNQNSTITEPEILQTIDTDQLAQQIVDLLLPSQQQLDTDQLAQQIADKIILPEPLIQQIKPQEIDTNQLAQQIADKIVLPPIYQTLPQISGDDLSISYAHQWILKLILIVVIFIVIIIGLILYVRKFRKKKLKNSFDSLIIREPKAASVKLSNGSEISYEKWQNINPKPEISTVDFWVPINNESNIGITNVSIGLIQSEHEITKQDLTRIKTIPLPDLSTDNYYYHSFSVSQKRIGQLDTVPIFVGIKICYDTGNNVNRNIGYSQAIYKINNNTISLV